MPSGKSLTQLQCSYRNLLPRHVFALTACYHAFSSLSSVWESEALSAFNSCVLPKVTLKEPTEPIKPGQAWFLTIAIPWNRTPAFEVYQASCTPHRPWHLSPSMLELLAAPRHCSLQNSAKGAELLAAAGLFAHTWTHGPYEAIPGWRAYCRSGSQQASLLQHEPFAIQVHFPHPSKDHLEAKQKSHVKTHVGTVSPSSHHSEVLSSPLPQEQNEPWNQKQIRAFYEVEKKSATGCMIPRWPKTSYSKSQSSHKEPHCLCTYANTYIQLCVYFLYWNMSLIVKNRPEQLLFYYYLVVTNLLLKRWKWYHVSILGPCTTSMPTLRQSHLQYVGGAGQLLHHIFQQH